MIHCWNCSLCAACNLFLADKQKIHYTFTDGSEMVEEYDLRNCDLLGNVVVYEMSSDDCG